MPKKKLKCAHALIRTPIGLDVCPEQVFYSLREIQQRYPGCTVLQYPVKKDGDGFIEVEKEES